MNASEATMLYYRGYLIESRLCADWVPDPREVWAVLRTAPSGLLEEVGVLDSERDAKKLIDELATPVR